LTVVGCEEEVITVCGGYILADEEKKIKEKKKPRKHWIHKVFRATVEEEEFQTL